MVGDLTGDGVTEFVVTYASAAAGAKSWDVIYRIDTDGPSV